MTTPRIYADFHRIHTPRSPGRTAISLDTFGSATDLARAGVKLYDGCRVTIYMDSDEEEDIEADAVVFFDHEQGCWMAEIDESEIRDVPARGRDPRPFVCVACRAELPPHPTADGWVVESCPRCGTYYAAAIAPPAG